MTKIKICGLTRAADALVAAECGADFLGFIFYPPSPRCAQPQAVREIIAQVRQKGSTPACVGVFVDAGVAEILEIAGTCGLDYAQLHGHETPAQIKTLQSHGLKVIKGFRVRDAATLATLAAYHPDVYLLDTYVKGQMGGTGHSFDWTLAREAQATYNPILLAGGLNPGNVAQAIRAAHPWGVDVSSGIERVAGEKDHTKLRALITAVAQTHIADRPEKIQGQTHSGETK